MECVHTSVGGEITPVANKSKRWIHERLTGCASVLNSLVTRYVSEKRLVGKKCLISLSELLRAEKRRLDQKL
jgi:hypothetical protein